MSIIIILFKIVSVAIAVRKIIPLGCLEKKPIDGCTLF